MENMLHNEQAPRPIWDQVNRMLGKAKDLFFDGLKGISEIAMSAIATKINEQDPQSARDAMSYLFKQSGLNDQGALSGMKNRLLAYKNTPRGKETLN